MGESKPRLRGWLHLCAIPIVLICGLLILSFAPTPTARLSIAIFLFFSIQLFSVSAIYHRSSGVIDEKHTEFFQKLDHASIPFLIGGSATPFAVLLLNGGARISLLVIIWILVLAISISRFYMQFLPKWLNFSGFFVLGWVPIIFLPGFIDGSSKLGVNGSWAVIGLIVLGGILYTAGGIVFFGLKPKWTNRWERTWGYHEWWHLSTVLAYSCHFVAVALVAYNL